MAETTTATFDTFAACRTSLAAWSMRSAPSSELPPNLNATTLLRLSTPPQQRSSLWCAAGLGSEASSNPCSRFMSCAPGFHSQVRRRERLSGGGGKKRNPPPPSLPGEGLKIFFAFYLFFPCPAPQA